MTRSTLPTNERLAIVETETESIKSAVLDIKDAVVAIRVAVERVAVIEERQAGIQEHSRRLDRAIEAEREARMSAVDAEARERKVEQKSLADKVKSLETAGEMNTHARSWLERLAIPLVAGAIGAGLHAFLV